MSVCYFLDSHDVEEAILTACRLDVIAFKPGNVSLDSPGHGMTAADFLLSARIIAPILSAAGATVGQRIRRSVEATAAGVGCNTNLGIVLLAAPLAHAALQHSADPGLRPRVNGVLSRLTVDDAKQAFAAIRCARPAGLGRSQDQDVRGEPTLDLFSVMACAAERDRIAYQYAHSFEDVFLVGVGAVREYLNRWGSLAWATVGCYLRFLGAIPDSHVQRKFGPGVAGEVLGLAAEVETVLKACENPQSHGLVLEEFDRDLKARGVNPGTSADLTVASLIAFWLEREPPRQKIQSNATFRCGADCKKYF